MASQNLVTQTERKWSLSRDSAGSYPVVWFPGHTAGEQPSLHEGAVAHNSGKVQSLRALLVFYCAVLEQQVS